MISLNRVTRIFNSRDGDQVTALEDVSLSIRANEFITLVGPSGCGKSTTLKMINRLIEPTSGRIFLEGRDVTAEDPVQLRRRIGYVIQQIGLFPHQTVGENIATVPGLLGWPKAQRKPRATGLSGMWPEV